MFGDFIKAFDGANEIIICDIYDVAGREENKISKKVNSEKMAKEIKKRGKEVYFIPDFKKIPRFLKKRVKKNDIVLIMGAGDIYKIASDF